MVTAKTGTRTVDAGGGPRTPGRSRRGFTLVEMLVVLAIIAILAVLSTLALAGLTSSLHVTQSSEVIKDILLLARSRALSDSHIVEVRFFQCQNPAVPGSGAQWCAMQAVEIMEDGSENPVSPATFLPNGGMMSGSATASTLLQSELFYTPTLPTPATLGTVTSECRFRYMPNGSTDLSLYTPAPAQWFVTAYNENDAAKGNPPPDYATLVVEPFTGAVTTIRP